MANHAVNYAKIRQSQIFLLSVEGRGQGVEASLYKACYAVMPVVIGVEQVGFRVVEVL